MYFPASDYFGLTKWVLSNLIVGPLELFSYYFVDMYCNTPSYFNEGSVECEYALAWNGFIDGHSLHVATSDLCNH